MIPTPTVYLTPAYLAGDYDAAYSSAFRTNATAPVDVTCLVDTLTIQHGRNGTASQPEASALTVDLSLDTAEDGLPRGLDIGAVLTVFLYTPGHAPFTRFTGPITDFAYGWDDRGEDTPASLVAQVIATGPLAELGRRVLPGPWGAFEELDGARVALILSQAPVPVGSTDPGTVLLVPLTFPTATMGELAYPAATSGRGVIWQDRDGLIHYADADHRRSTPLALTLDSCDLLVTPQWLRNTEGLANSVTVTYGPTGGDRPVYADENTASQSRYGFNDYAVDTQLSRAIDAEVYGDFVLSRNADPAWQLDRLPIATADLDSPTTLTVLALEIHSLIQVLLPPAGEAPTAAAVFVEGWEETISAGVWEFVLSVSDVSRSVPGTNWDEVDPALRWDDVDPALTWDSIMTEPLGV